MKDLYIAISIVVFVGLFVVDMHSREVGFVAIVRDKLGKNSDERYISRLIHESILYRISAVLAVMLVLSGAALGLWYKITNASFGIWGMAVPAVLMLACFAIRLAAFLRIVKSE
ncbi:MAG: hypothetical protein ACJ8EB_04700 [Allosphingosinicella sp.]